MWIDEVKALPHQRLFVVENHAMEVDKRLGIHKDAHIFKVVNAVAFSRLRVESNVIRQTGTAAALNAEAESPLLRRDSFFSHGYANPLQSTLRDLDALLIRRGILRIEDGWLHLAAQCATETVASAVSVTWFFFFQSPIAARIASSASTEQ